MVENYEKDINNVLRFYRKAQKLFFFIFSISIGLIVFVNVVTLHVIAWSPKIITFMLIFIVITSLYLYREAKLNQEIIEDFSVVYMMSHLDKESHKIVGDKKDEKRK